MRAVRRAAVFSFEIAMSVSVGRGGRTIVMVGGAVMALLISLLVPLLLARPVVIAVLSVVGTADLTGRRPLVAAVVVAVSTRTRR